MLNRSAVVIGHEPAFYGWLKTSGITDEAIEQRKEIAEPSTCVMALAGIACGGYTMWRRRKRT